MTGQPGDLGFCRAHIPHACLRARQGALEGGDFVAKTGVLAGLSLFNEGQGIWHRLLRNATPLIGEPDLESGRYRLDARFEGCACRVDLRVRRAFRLGHSLCEMLPVTRLGPIPNFSRRRFVGVSPREIIARLLVTCCECPRGCRDALATDYLGDALDQL